jgi:hypothetical protein
METAVKSNAVSNKANDKKEAFVNNNPVNKDNSKTAEAGKSEQPINGAKVEPLAKPGEPVKTEPKAEVKTEPAKETVKAEPAKPVLNLEGTLKLVEELHRRKIQRDKLLETIQNLESFEFDLKEEADETGGNVYPGCVLTITDDNRRSFTTKNPTIIWTVAQMVNRLCVDKLSEIEAGITIPA